VARWDATKPLPGIVVYLLLARVIARDAAAVAGMASIASLRLAAILWDLTVPVFSLRAPRDEQREKD
jgi:hypothetical protein